MVAALEGDSEHPIARGIREEAQKRKAQPVKIVDFEALKGRGIKATSDGNTVYAGGPRLLESTEFETRQAKSPPSRSKLKRRHSQSSI